VTVGAYDDFVRETNAVKPWIDSMPNLRWPVTRVTWPEAVSYCRWRHPNGGRLPSEEEWEASARGPDGHMYPWGEKFERTNANTASSGRNAIAPVGSFPGGATPQGVQDMIGNVWEWTSSPMAAYPGAAAMPDSMSQFRVIRGGRYSAADAISNGWFRGYNRPSTSPKDLELTAFRCARSEPARSN